MTTCRSGKSSLARAFLVFAVFGLMLFRGESACAEGADGGKNPPPDQIDQIVALLPPPPDFQSVRDLFVQYRLRVKSALVSRETEQDAVVVRIDFFLPVPSHCHPSREEMNQYYLEEAVWTKSESADSFLPVNRWARHISRNESDWFQNIACYP